MWTYELTHYDYDRNGYNEDIRDVAEIYCDGEPICEIDMRDWPQAVAEALARQICARMNG